MMPQPDACSSISAYAVRTVLKRVYSRHARVTSPVSTEHRPFSRECAATFRCTARWHPLTSKRTQHSVERQAAASLAVGLSRSGKLLIDESRQRDRQIIGQTGELYPMDVLTRVAL